jgi:hypothetical protein
MQGSTSRGRKVEVVAARSLVEDTVDTALVTCTEHILRHSISVAMVKGIDR